MSAMDELQAMLTARGVEWKEHRHMLAGSMAIQRETLWGHPTDNASGKTIPHVYHNRATEMADGRLFLEAQLVTPEQAVEATLGRMECSITRDFRCSECGHQYPTVNYDFYETNDGRQACYSTGYLQLAYERPHYCPNCGRRLKKD